MCQSYRKRCACGQRTADLFFGKMVLDEAAVAEVYCPQCSAAADLDPAAAVQDNGWVLQLDPEVLRTFAPRMGLAAEGLTADQVFDGDFVTWVGFSPDDSVRRNEERAEISRHHEGDLKGQFEALKRWAIEREQRFHDQGWRKAKASQQLNA